MLNQIKKDLQKLKSPEKAKVFQRFFKTGKGEYGEGDIFLGLSVPETREISKKYIELNLNDIQKLLLSKIHEERLVALLILVEKYRKSNLEDRKAVIKFYLKNAKNVNNWDLVDLTADKILGNYLIDKDKSVLYKLSKSGNLWERRIAIISTFAFIKNNKFDDSIKVSEILLNDKHDLIHKAVGWMLREIGKRDEKKLLGFLDKYYKIMPRTMLRYAVERLDKKKKKIYMGRLHDNLK